MQLQQIAMFHRYACDAAGLKYIPNPNRERSVQMEALRRVKELFPNLAGISSGVIVALFDLGYP